MAETIRAFVVANCQAPFIASALELLNPSIKATNLVAFQAKRDKVDVYAEQIAKSDVVLHFDIKQGFLCPPLETANVRAAAGKRAHTITNLYFAGLHPDLVYVGGMNKRLVGPFGDYHSKIALISYLKGVPAVEAAALLQNDRAVETMGYGSVFAASSAELRQRDTANFIPYADRFLSQVAGDRLALYTFNHPAAWVIVDFARFILQTLGIPHEDIPSEVVPAWLLNGPVLPILKSVKAQLGLGFDLTRWKRPAAPNWIDDIEAIEQFHTFYRTVDPKTLIYPALAQDMERFEAARKG